MDPEGFVGWLSRQHGAVHASLAPRDLMERIVAEESTVMSSFGTPVDNSGLRDCLRHGTIAVVFTDRTFRVPSTVSMVLRNEKGEIVGHNVPEGMLTELSGRDDVVFISDDFVLYPETSLGKGPVMELRSKPYRGDGDTAPEGIDPVIWFPSTTSSEIIHRWFGIPVTDLGTALVAVDLYRRA